MLVAESLNSCSYSQEWPYVGVWFSLHIQLKEPSLLTMSHLLILHVQNRSVSWSPPPPCMLDTPQTVLSDFELEVPAGKVTALCGLSGAGEC